MLPVTTRVTPATKKPTSVSARTPVTKAAPMPKPTVADEDPPFDTDDTPAASAPVQSASKPAQKAEDILALIRARQTKQ